MTEMENVPNKAGLHFVENEEGKKPWVYDDKKGGKPYHPADLVVGKLTFGVGHLIQPGEHFPIHPNEADQETIDSLFKKDCAERIVFFRQVLKGIKLNQNQVNALFSLMYNIGDSAFAGSTLVRMLKAGAIEEASRQFLRWKYSGGEPILLNRRTRERALFDKPISAAKPLPAPKAKKDNSAKLQRKPPESQPKPIAGHCIRGLEPSDCKCQPPCSLAPEHLPEK